MTDFRRSGLDRRRRVLNDDVLARPQEPAEDAAPAPAQPRRARKPDTRYAEAASMETQPRIIDLIPRKVGSFVLWFFAGLAAIGGLVALYAYMPKLAGMTTDGRVAAFDLDSEGSLGAYFSSLLLFASAATAMLVWSIRRHRVDDYHGRYRIWLWAAMCWFVMSVDESCSLHEGFKELVSHLTQRRLIGDGSIWWAIPYAVVLPVVGLRLLFEMRGCRTSMTTLVLAGGCFAAAVVTQMQFIMPDRGAEGVMLEEALEMLGDLFLLLSMTFHARHVILDMQGLLPGSETVEKPKRTRRRKPVVEGEEPAAAKPTEDKPAKPVEKKAVIATPTAATAPKPATPLGRQVAASSAARIDPPQAPAGEHRKLSKAERRAMRRADRDDE